MVMLMEWIKTKQIFLYKIREYQGKSYIVYLFLQTFKNQKFVNDNFTAEGYQI